MDTKYLQDRNEDLQTAGQILRDGGTVVFPTETVYGLGANALCVQAVQKIFQAKGRPSDNPLIVHIADRALLSDLVQEIPVSAQKLMDKFWPGPLTLIFQKSEQIPYAVTGGMETVAIRMPAHPVAQKLLRYAEVPVAAPSANLSGLPSPTAFSHVKKDMDGRVDAIIDGGDSAVGVESTVLDLSTSTPVLYRPGGITQEEIEKVIGKVEILTKVKEGEAPKSPGLKYKHYAPKAEVLILHGDLHKVKEYVQSRTCNAKVGMLVFDEFPQFDPLVTTYSLGSQSDPSSAAHRLFDGLRSLDEKGVSCILAPEIPDYGVWSAVRNRLYRAAGEHILDLTAKKPCYLLVCTGNTCRSPMAEAILRQTAETDKAEIAVSSAGLSGCGALASDFSCAVMREIGIDLSEHRSALVSKENIEAADHVLTMTRAHRDLLCAMFPQFTDKIQTLGAWADEGDLDVLDPYGGTMEDYRSCRDQLTNLIQKGWRMHR